MAMIAPKLFLLICIYLPVATWTFSGSVHVSFTTRPSQQHTHREIVTRPSLTPQPFGIRPSTTKWRKPSVTYPIVSSPALFAAAAGGGDDEDDIDDSWEPDEDDILNDLEELDDLEDSVEDDDEDVEGFQSTNAVVDDDDDEDRIRYSDDDDEDDDFDPDDEDDDEFDVEDLEDEEEEDDDMWEEEEDDEEDDEETEDDDDIEAEFEEEEENEDGEWEYEYVYEDPEFEWDPDGGLDEEFFDDAIAKVPLRDDPDDPLYNAQKKLVVETATRREKLGGYEDFDALKYMADGITPEEIEALDNTELEKETIRQTAPFMTLGPQDVENLNLSEELSKVTDMFTDDPPVSTNITNYLGTGINSDDIMALDEAWKYIHETFDQENWNKVDLKLEKLQFELLDNETIVEMGTVIRNIESAGYLYPKWLLYDLDFNVTNLILAAIKHNPDAPLLLMHWYPQLMTYSRYQHARDRNFDFTHEDVENADISELERYYLGFGYDEIPFKAPAETGIIGVEEADEEEIKMAAFEAWMLEVYNSEWDRKDFDDEEIRDEDNVFSDNFEMPNHPDLPTWEDAESDMAAYNEEMGEDLNEEYRDFYAKRVELKPGNDNGGLIEDFRGHLVIACGPFKDDLDTAETITTRMKKEFGDSVYVETRVIMHAQEDDNVYEVWLESYEVDLLHSRRRNYMQTSGWTGPANVDAAQLEYLVEEVRKLTSEDARLSDRVEEMNILL
ncbi:hypothetical protein IV203_030945 [Nitzschia inconspicua]|uniref:Uncharacterized protein n=1 Tax=Nitzschia inconspicua TaxID=303405 RepID=A0A9K3Q1Q1_9STRA|nr:hypothetical protein IV203_030945 [Nitzschia inconspicua]